MDIGTWPYLCKVQLPSDKLPCHANTHTHAHVPTNTLLFFKVAFFNAVVVFVVVVVVVVVVLVVVVVANHFQYRVV